MTRKTIYVRKAREAIRLLEWIMQVAGNYIEKEYMDAQDVTYDISMDDLLSDVVNHGRFSVITKRDVFFGNRKIPAKTIVELKFI